MGPGALPGLFLALPPLEVAYGVLLMCFGRMKKRRLNRQADEASDTISARRRVAEQRVMSGPGRLLGPFPFA
jgi:hypothetical protein